MATTPANATNALTTGQVSFSGTAFSASTLTQFDVLVGGASNAISSVGPGSAGQVLQSGGNAANPVYSTATYPATAGTSGNVITSNGTNFSSTTPAASGATWVLIQSQDASNVASISFTTGITSTYKNLVLIYSNVYPITDNQNLLLQFSTNGGSSYLNSSYLSGLTCWGWNSTTQANVSLTTAVVLSPTLHTVAGGGSAPAGGQVNFYNITTGGSPSWSIEGANVSNTSGSGFYVGGGIYQSGITVNALQITSASGNISSGTFTLYGLRSA